MILFALLLRKKNSVKIKYVNKEFSFDMTAPKRVLSHASGDEKKKEVELRKKFSFVEMSSPIENSRPITRSIARDTATSVPPPTTETQVPNVEPAFTRV